MQATDFVGVAVSDHITRSLEELKNPECAERWLNGERAREQASRIILSIIADAEQRLSGKDSDHE